MKLTLCTSKSDADGKVSYMILKGHHLQTNAAVFCFQLGMQMFAPGEFTAVDVRPEKEDAWEAYRDRVLTEEEANELGVGL